MFWILFVQGTTRSTYARDSYWLSSVCLQQRIDQGSFSSIQEMRDEVANLHSIAQRSNMENKVIKHWLDLLNFLNMLLQNIGNQPQGWALQQIREKFGTNCGISKKKKKLADKIIRDNLRNQISSYAPPMMPQTFLPMGGVLSALPTPPMAMFQQNMRPDILTLQPLQPLQALDHVLTAIRKDTWLEIALFLKEVSEEIFSPTTKNLDQKPLVKRSRH